MRNTTLLDNKRQRHLMSELLSRWMLTGEEEWKTGWGVVRVSPWRLPAIFDSEADAPECQQQLGKDNIVRFGTGFPRSSEFPWDAMNDSP